MNNIIDESSIKGFPPDSEKDQEKKLNDLLLGGNQYKTVEKPVQKQEVPVEAVPDENGGAFDGNAQITLTFDQLMELLSKTKNAPETQAPPVEEKPKEEPPEDPEGTGTRIIYQSEDFDSAQETKKTFPRYDEDDIFDSEEFSKETIQNIRKNSREGTYTPISANDRRFRVSEMEYSAEDLPELRERRISDSPNVARIGNSNVPYMLTSNAPRVIKSGNVRIEEFEIRENQPVVEKDSGEKEEKKPLTRGEKARRIILIIALIAIVASGAYLAREYFLHKENEELESEISNLIIDVPTTETTTKAKAKSKKKKETPSAQSTTAQTTTERVKTEEEQWAEIKAQYPSTEFPIGMQLKYAKLYATNKDFVGYLEAENTRLSLPIVQNGDDDSTSSYLNKNFYGKSTKYGCPFVSSFNIIAEDLKDYNTVIYGHHMNDRTIFGALDAYKKLDGFKQAPIIKFNTLYKDYSWKIIAAFITNDNPKDDNGYKFVYSFVNLSNEVYKQTYLNELAKRSIYDTGVDVNPDDKLLTLSTCSHEFDDARFVVVARMVRAGESTDVDVSKAFVNQSPRYPQKYYDVKKQTNPYANDTNWFGE